MESTPSFRKKINAILATVKPFPAVRPARDKVHLVASRSYVSYTPQQLRSKLTENPFSFLHIIHPDMSATKLHKSGNLDQRFQMVRDKYDAFLDQEILLRENKSCFYIYQQIKNGHAFIGIVGAVSIADYLDGKIKIHEQTLSKREQTFVNYLDITNINAEPVLLMSEINPELSKIFDHYKSHRPEYDFTTTNRVRHMVWVIEDEAHNEKIEKIYGSMDALYVADGHHRSSSSAKLYEMRGSQPNDPSAQCLAYILQEDNVKIYPWHRVVHDLNQLEPQKFLAALGAHFQILPLKIVQEPTQGTFVMYLRKKWYHLIPIKESQDLDTQILTDLVLTPILGIKDLRKDKRIHFLEGPRGHEGLRHSVDKSKEGVGFLLHTTNIDDIKKIADTGQTMPPKSTWVEPKLRSGLLVYELSQPTEK
jgi:uncharacterized protein (DUF1015 family)